MTSKAESSQTESSKTEPSKTEPGKTEPGRTPTAPRRGRAGGFLLVLIVAAGGVYAGVRWHERIAPVLGMSVASGGAAAERGGTSGDAPQLWTCGMHPQVMQDGPGDCPICHMELTPLNVGNTPVGGGTPGGTSTQPTGGMSAGGPDRKVRYWWDPMLSPPYISDKPGKSPMGMDLIPVYEDDATGGGGGGQVIIDPVVVQNMGVRVALVSEGPLSKHVRLVGYLDQAQPNIQDVNLLVSGWIRRLYADTEGMHVQAGDPLFDLYSPELQIAIEELIASRRARGSLPRDGVASAEAGMNGAAGTRDMAAALYDAAARKLELLGLPRAQIDALARLDLAPQTITFTSPISGDVTEKPVVEGAAVMAGDRVLRIVDHSTLWLDAQVFEKDLPFVQIGQRASATIASRPNDAAEGEIVFVHPRVDAMTRTALVRLSIPNPTLALKPGMYATVRLESQIAERAVMVPREAIIDTGESQMAFIAEAVGRFQPRKVRMGLPGENGMVQVIEGLAPGEAVVTSGQFLIDSESRLREAIQKFLNEKTQVSQASSPAGLPPSDSAPTPVIDATPAQLQRVDALVSAYLAISASLGATQPATPAPEPLDMGTVIAAAQALHGEASASPIEPLATSVATAAEAMKDHPLDHQRQAFKGLSERMIALVEAVAPTRGAAEKLFVAHCPMFPGSWLQTTEEIANPYYATQMKRCGVIVKPIRVLERR